MKLNMRRLLLIAVLSAATLTGCEESGTTATGSPSGTCDPHGFGPLSGCGEDQESSPKPVAQGNSTACDPHGFKAFQPKHCQDGGSEPSGDDSVGDTASCPPETYLCTMGARHEAGHKAVADEYGWSVSSMWVHSDGSSWLEGRTNIVGFALKDPRQKLACLYAGAIAAGTDEGADKDFNAANSVLDDFPESQRDDIESSARAEARQIVNSRAGQIDHDAESLLAGGDPS